ncbi:ankyrin repeat domain-containing protein 27 [Elysia marginata]|uniref:Ankyrin repeat domain-containing protein 27 n=1 Tax=Elysia marginata TaxID=1093978 RepID=A0AAV4H7Y3_9GAST|nr:ankyrin repeat domain-containing protein 27 [Elysia marginata]
MASKYDEDVYENPFFTKIISEHQDHLERAASSKGILCIPKFSVSSHASVTEVDITDHILLPTKENNNGEGDGGGEEDDDYITISGKYLHYFSYFYGKSSIVSELFVVSILEIAKGASSTVKHSSPASYQQCLDLLWSRPDRQKVRLSLDKIMESFAASYDSLEGESLRSIVRKSARHNRQYMENLKIAVETYMMNAVHKQLFRVITATMANEDAEINKITRNLVDLQLSDLGIRKIFSQNMIPAKKELGLLNRYSTPMGRLFCIKRVVAALTKPPREVKKEKRKDSVSMMTTDDLLPILIFLIIKSDIPNWMANLVYMQHFHFAKSSDDDEFGFYLASVEASIEHIRSGNLKNETMTLKRERWNSIIIQDPTDPASLSKSLSPLHTSIDDFFKLVQEGDEQKVVQMLDRPNKTTEEVQLKLCHPLCSCDKCDRLLAALRNNSDLVTAYTRDNRGYTALHIAAYYGQGMLIDQLVKHQAIVDATDYLGLTPLHLACQRGYQNVMCVKALVFYDANLNMLDINSTNEVGDTPLHLAAKWGYESIVKTLLESGADSTIQNRKKQTAVYLAQNIKVQRLLQLAADGLDLRPIRPKFESEAARPRQGSSTSSTSGSFLSTLRSPSISAKLDTDAPSFTVQTASLEEASEKEKHRHKEKLFKAIIEGDIQLVKFYLGIDGSHGIYDDLDDEEGSVVTMSPKSLADMCHPLCQCERCLNIQKASRYSKGLVDVNSRTSTGYCPVHMAVLHNHSDILGLLISLHADISAQNHKSLTPLHLACCVRNSLTTDMLIKAGAKLDIQDMNGDTPLLIAASNGFINGVHMLIQSRANLNVVNARGNTALHEALKRDHTDTAACLLKAGADPRIKNIHSQLPAQLTQDATTHALIRSAILILEDKAKERQKREKLRANSVIKKTKRDGEKQVSIRDLFSAFEKADLDNLQNLTSAIKSFNRDSALKKAETRDRSQTVLSDMARRHSIVSFNKGLLKKVKSLDRTDPLYTYSLFQEGCRVFDAQDNPNHVSRELDSLEKLTRSRDDSLNHVRNFSCYEGSNDWTIIFQKQRTPSGDLETENPEVKSCEKEADKMEGIVENGQDSDLCYETNNDEARPVLTKSMPASGTNFYGDVQGPQSQTAPPSITISTTDCNHETEQANLQAFNDSSSDDQLFSYLETDNTLPNANDSDSDTEQAQFKISIDCNSDLGNVLPQTQQFSSAANSSKGDTPHLIYGLNHESKLPAEVGLPSTSVHCDSGFLEESSSNRS